ERHVLKGQESKLTSLAFNADGTVLASGGVANAPLPGITGLTQGDRIHLWDPARGEKRKVLELRGQTVAFSADGRRLASAGLIVTTTPAAGGGMSLDGGSRVALWDAEASREIGVLQGHGMTVAFSPDSRFIATAWGSRLHQGGIVLTGDDKQK